MEHMRVEGDEYEEERRMLKEKVIVVITGEEE